MGTFMDAFFFRQFFVGTGIEALQKFAEAHAVDQLVCDDIETEWEKLHIRRFF